MSAWPMVTLGEACRKVSTWSPARAAPDVAFTYIDLSAVDQTSKRITGSQAVLGADAPSRARQLVASGDVLMSTVRPNLNAVAHVGRDLDGATASTGFAVLRVDHRFIDDRYLFQWVKSPMFVDDMARKATGASYPAVSDRIVKASSIPLPPLPEQRRIAAILDHADELRTKRREALAHLDELAQSIFIDMFGDATNRWPMATVADIASPARGAMRTGPFGSQLLHEEFTDSGVAVLGIDNAVANSFRWAQRRYISEEKYVSLQRFTVNPGDVLITIMGTCGRCAIVPDDIPRAINTKHLCCITLDKQKALPQYLHAYFLQHPAARSYLERTAKGAIMSGLNMGIIKEMPIAVPSLALQLAFAERLDSVEPTRNQHMTALAELDALFASLQSRAFRGDL